MFPSADAGQRSASAQLNNAELVTLLQTRDPLLDKQYLEYLFTCYSQVYQYAGPQTAPLSDVNLSFPLAN